MISARPDGLEGKEVEEARELAARDEPATTSVRALNRAPGTGSILLASTGRIALGDLPRLCDEVRALLTRSESTLILCDVGALGGPDAVTVDALARVQLVARRLGREISFHNATVDLRELLEFMGLSDVLPLSANLALEPGGETEQRKPSSGVEEERDPADPTAR